LIAFNSVHKFALAIYMFKEKKSFFDRFTNIINSRERDDDFDEAPMAVSLLGKKEQAGETDDTEEEENEGELAIDLYQTPSEIILHAMVAGVRPEDLEISINREMVTIRGKRERIRAVTHDNYFFKELYWGTFSRTIVLPEEIDVEAAEATSQHGLLSIRLPKIDKKKTQKLKVRMS